MNILKNKKGLSTVVTTLIILVVSVLLATVVTFYAINVTTTRVQEESLSMTQSHIWYNTSGGWAEAAISITNTGGKDVVINQLTVRGQAATWANVYYNRTTAGANGLLNVTTTDPFLSTTTTMTLGGVAKIFKQATGELTVKSGDTIVIYITHPDSVALNDVGVTVGITAFTANAQYYREVNVQAAQ